MPLGNGGPRGLASAPLGVLQDPRTYYRAWSPGNGAGGNTDETPIASPYSSGAIRGQLSPYARAILGTPGLMNWWRLGKIVTGPAVTGLSKAPFFANSAGGPTLRTQGVGTASLVAGLIPGDSDGACKLDGSSYLDAFDYKVYMSSAEGSFSVEAWIKVTTLATEFGIVTAWGDGIADGHTWGWMLYCPGSSGDVLLYTGDHHFAASGVLATNKLFHIVGVWGGEQGPTPDYYSRIYVNGVSVASALTVPTSYFDILVPSSGAAQCRMQIGAYNQGVSNSGFLTGVVDEVAVYNRMLQPEEVLQHYRAAFARA